MCRCLAALLLCAALAPADDKTEPPDPKAAKPREITLDGNRPRLRGRFDQPTKIATAKELEKSIADKDMRAAILKQVDLKKEYLVLFAWAGSGGDRVTMKANKDQSEVTFTRTLGLTDDLHFHFRLFALPSKAKYKVK